MPVIQPALVSLAVITFLTSYNDYFWPLVILQTLDMQTIQITWPCCKPTHRLPPLP